MFIFVSTVYGQVEETQKKIIEELSNEIFADPGTEYLDSPPNAILLYKKLKMNVNHQDIIYMLDYNNPIVNMYGFVLALNTFDNYKTVLKAVKSYRKRNYMPILPVLEGDVVLEQKLPDYMLTYLSRKNDLPSSKKEKLKGKLQEWAEHYTY